MKPTSPSPNQKKFFCCATYIPVCKWRQVFPLLWLTQLVQIQLIGTPGYIRSQIRSDMNLMGLLFPFITFFTSLDKKYYQKRFWTFTVWENRESPLNFFANSYFHRQGVKVFNSWARPTARIVIW
ncbi:MAG: hypothetical protein SAJ37_03565 [Oscillatoria sp. PMC 1068.18]|nr:hypothetical protein [Oscillatoria sp. PMC 1076.18]MEC4987805.1 hypothetical protein [Oscillatoria sp. PMC 1068.18]